MKKIIIKIASVIFVIVMAVGFSACDNGAKKPTIDGGNIDDGTDINSGIENIINEADCVKKVDNASTDDAEDLEGNEVWKNHVTINCGDTIKVVNSNPAEITVKVTGGNIVIDSLKKMDLTLSGTLNGSVRVNKPDGKLKLVLNGITINSSSGPAINLQTQKRIYLVVADNTVNNLTDSNNHPVLENGDNTKAALFAKEKLNISGNGALNVTGNYMHGIASDDYIRVISGNINVVSAVKDGFHTNDAVFLDGGKVSISAANDGIECDAGAIVVNGGLYNITAKVGISATYVSDATIDPYVTINNGIIKITALGEGITSKSVLTVNGGYVCVNSGDDGFNAEKDVTITNGYVFAQSSNNDGIDSNGTLNISGGVIVTLGGSAPEEGLDCNSNTFKVTGGIIVAAGGTTSLPTASVCTQGIIIYGEIEKNSLLSLLKGEDNCITFKFSKSYATILLSAPQIVPGADYSICKGGAASGNMFHGLYFNTTYTKGEDCHKFATSSVLTHLGGEIIHK